MTDIWEPTPEAPPLRFAELEMLIETVPGKKGDYTKITFNTMPLDGGEFKSSQYFKFANHTKPWDSHVLPRIRELIAEGKIKTGPELNGKFVSYRFDQWPSYSKRDIEYYEENSPEYLQFDEKGKQFVNKLFFYIVDVFNTEAECRAAHDAHYNIEGGSNPFGGADDDVPIAMPKIALDADVALGLVPNFEAQLTEVFKTAFGDNHKFDADKARQVLNSPDGIPILGNLDFDAKPVKAIIEKLETSPPW